MKIQRYNKHLRIGWISSLFCLFLGLAVSGCLDLRSATKNPQSEKESIFDARLTHPTNDGRPDEDVRSILKKYHADDSYKEIKILYPYNNSIFPPEIASPTFKWTVEGDLQTWLVMIDFGKRHKPLYILCDKTGWTPSREIWDLIKEFSKEDQARITILGVNPDSNYKVFFRGTVTISTSKDEVGAPIMFRRVPPSFEYASTFPESMEWCLGDISSYDEPPVIMSNLHVCASCHTFSGDGKVFGMDMDYKNNKGAYAFADVNESVTLTDQNFVNWNDFPRDDGLQSTGLFSRISPDGKHVVSTINEIHFLAKISDPYCSQLFYPIQGNIACYSKDDKKINLLATGAEGKEIVQTEPSWSPDGKYVLFSSATMTRDFYVELKGNTVFKSEDAGIDELNKQYPVQFNIYRVPFNNGMGGQAEPILGASNNGKSNYCARYSPDGRWIVFTQSITGLAVQPDSKLYLVPSTGGEAKLMNCNLSRLNSWHTWSPNSRWLAFVSKESSAYTELFLTHIDENGNDSPPILIGRFNKTNFAINVPEFADIPSGGIQQIILQGS